MTSVIYAFGLLLAFRPALLRHFRGAKGNCVSTFLMPLVVGVCITPLLTGFASAQEHRVEIIKEAPKSTGLSPEMTAMLPQEGFKVLRGASRVVCEVWPTQKWETEADFKPTSERLYPFKPGQLIGFVHFQRRGNDFRDQTMKSGWYTLRYGLQPIDGNHTGTSPTRDFLLMVRAEDDKSPEPFPMKELLLASAKAADSAHPAMLCFQQAKKDAPKKPSMRHVEETDWWILHFTGVAVADGTTNDLSVDLIVAGHADE